ncbi:cytochrome P450 [Aspergillus varians]
MLSKLLRNIITLVASKFIYNIWLHPLSRYPGPRTWAASSIPISRAQLRGDSHLLIEKLHNRYGSVVRIAPNELSFISAPAWSDIYGRSAGRTPLPRDKTFFNEMLVSPQTITMANDENHARLRRSMAPGFSPRALRDQEPIIQKNVNLLIAQLEKRAAQGLLTDLRDWYNFATFDLIGDLAFGESFGSLETSRAHDWVGFVLEHFYVSSLLQVVHRFRPLNRMIACLIPKSSMERRETHDRLTKEKVTKRFGMAVERPDFTHHMLQAAERGDITVQEVEKQASILILAGSETTAVTLSFVTYLLIQDQRVQEKLRREIMETFQKEDEVDLLSVNKLEYLQAVIQEALRLFPPITNGFPRQVSRAPAIVDGSFVPSQVTVNVHHWTAYRSEQNFALPSEFWPERWLGDGRFNRDVRGVFQPFSVGPRNCIGRQFAYDAMKLILAKVLWRFEMSLADESRGWLEGQKSFVSFHQPPLMVKLQVNMQ